MERPTVCPIRSPPPPQIGYFCLHSLRFCLCSTLLFWKDWNVFKHLWAIFHPFFFIEGLWKGAACILHVLKLSSISSAVIFKGHLPLHPLPGEFFHSCRNICKTGPALLAQLYYIVFYITLACLIAASEVGHVVLEQELLYGSDLEQWCP